MLLLKSCSPLDISLFHSLEISPWPIASIPPHTKPRVPSKKVVPARPTPLTNPDPNCAYQG